MKLTSVSRLRGRRSLGATSAGPVLALTIRQSVAAALLADSDLTAIVGSNVFPIYLPETTAPPALLYHFISDQAGHILASSDGTSIATVKFIAESKNYGDCDQILEAVRQLFDDYRGNLPGGVKAMGIFQQDDDDEYDEPDNASDRGMFTIATVYRFHYRLAKPRRFS